MLSKRILLLPLLVSLGVSACEAAATDPPVEDGHPFSYSPPAGAPAITSISVRGAFNAWGETPLEPRSDGSWRTTVELDPGTYEYKFFINGVWPADMCHDTTWGHANADYWIDPEAAGCVPDGHGGQNAVAAAGGDVGLLFTHDPGSATHVSAAGGRISIRFRVQRGRTSSATVTAGSVAYPMHVQLEPGLQEVWRAALPEGTGEYSFTLETTDGPQTFGPYTVPADPFRAVPWVGGGVGYQVFPERFWNGDPSNDSAAIETDVSHYMHAATWNVTPVLSAQWGGELTDFHCCHQYFGGDLQGIIDRLDHLDSLGVTLLYLNPIFTAGSAHGYDTFDYMEVAPNFGDTVVLRELLAQAGARGMRVMWDFVPNHTGVGHWAFQHAVANGTTSPNWDWYTFKVPASQIQVGNGNHYEAWWGFGTLPRLETRNPEVIEHLLEATRYWTEFGFDAIRVDVPIEIRNRSEFFPAFRAAAKAIDPEVYLIGEIWERDPSWLQGDQFDALMNYAIGEGVVQPFARGHTTGSAAAHEMAKLYADYPEAAAAMLFNLVSSHDTGRLLTKMGGGALGGVPGQEALARQRLASAILYALPGLPVTFQGDECAFLGTGEGPRAENRYPFQWNDCNADMLAHYRQLARWKAEVGAFSSPVLRSHESAGAVLSFFRGEPGPAEVLAVFNNSASAQSLMLPAGGWRDVVSGESLTGNGTVVAFGWRYLERQ